jgi:hypothetical protein
LVVYHRDQRPFHRGETRGPLGPADLGGFVERELLIAAIGFDRDVLAVASTLTSSPRRTPPQPEQAPRPVEQPAPRWRQRERDERDESGSGNPSLDLNAHGKSSARA